MASKRQTNPLGPIHRLPKVLSISGYGRTQLFECIARGEFPAPIKLSDTGRAIGWLDEELVVWRNSRISARDNGRKDEEQPNDEIPRPLRLNKRARRQRE